MKQKLKKIKLLLTLFLAGLLLFSCQKEDDVISAEKGTTIQHISFSELIKTAQFSQAVAKIKKPKTKIIHSNLTSGRTVMEQQYDFS